MDFGRVPQNFLDDVDFSLPADPARNSDILSTGDGSFDFRFGSAKWGRKEWVGTLYPKGTKEANFLDEYVKRFNYIEGNFCFYNIPKPEQMLEWGNKAKGNDIIFNLKMSRTITHVKRFADCKEEVDAFFNALSYFGLNLGRVFIQVSDNLSPDELLKVLTFLENLPSEYRYYVEFRHHEIFSNKESFNRLTEFLTRKNIGLIITDTPGRRDVCHMALTVPEVMIRFVGNSGHNSEIPRLQAWADRLNKWRKQGLEKAYFCYSQFDLIKYEEDYVIAEKLFVDAGLLKARDTKVSG